MKTRIIIIRIKLCFPEQKNKILKVCNKQFLECSLDQKDDGKKQNKSMFALQIKGDSYCFTTKNIREKNYLIVF